MMKRTSPIAGSWYDGDKNGLNNQISQLFLDAEFGPGKEISSFSNEKNETKKLIGVVSPHAGYVYSGRIAAWSYYQLKQYYSELDICIILGPNHRGIGPPISVYPKGEWEFPTGNLKISLEAVNILSDLVDERSSSLLKFETTAHQTEHSIDIQGPFLTQLYGDSVEIVPICIGSQSLENSVKLSELIIELYGKLSHKKIAIVASSDLSHENDYSKLERNDKLILNEITNGDPKKVDEVRKRERVSMCGYSPILTLMIVTNKFGSSSFELLKYANSKQIHPGGDYTVGYPSIAAYIDL